MSVASLLEEFKVQQGFDIDGEGIEAEALEDEKLKSFEVGYGAGWDDAIRAQQDSGQHISDALEQAVKSLNATQEEVGLALLANLRPVMVETILRVMPVVADRTLPDRIMDLIEAEYRPSIELPVEIHGSPTQSDSLMQRFGSALENKARFIPDPMLTDDQVELRQGKTSHRLDTGALLEKIGTQLDEVFTEILKARHNEH